MYKKIKASNGLTVIASPMSGMSSVSIGFWVGVGGRYESPKESGLSHLVEHMLFKGTQTRGAKDLKRSIEGVGGAFNGFTSDEVTCYMVKVPAKYLELGIDILSDMVLNAKCDEMDILREKFVICEEIKMYRDQPADHVLDMLAALMWPNNALGQPLTGTIGTVKKFNRDAIMNFKSKNYHPNNIAVVAAGKINPDRMFKYVTEKFEKRKRKNKGSYKTPVIIQKNPRLKVLRGETKQAHIAMGFYAEADNLRERFAIKLMNVIYGGNMSSRLFEKLREKDGLCYDISSSYKRHSDMGEVQIHVGVDNKNVTNSIQAILGESQKLRDIGITEEELERAKKYTKGQFQLAMEGTATRMMWLGDRLLVHNNIPAVEDVLKRIDNVKLSEIKKVSKKIFTPSSANLAMIGRLNEKEKNKIRKILSKI